MTDTRQHEKTRQQIALHEFDALRPHGEAVLAGCTGRAGGVSRAPYDQLNLGLHVGDDANAVLENRRLLAEALGVERSAFVIPQQVHGGGVRVVGAADRGKGALTVEDAIPDTDALLTRETGVVLAVLLADCVPVILFDPATPAVGVVHAGWGGTVRHVTGNAVETMRREFGSDPGTLLAGVGPSIGLASYEVGADVAERARAAFPGGGVAQPRADGKFLLDLWSSNVIDLLDAGVPRERIEVAGLDTFQMSEQFFSHRRQQPTGRFMALAMLKDDAKELKARVKGRKGVGGELKGCR
jgi:YfiH family protein